MLDTLTPAQAKEYCHGIVKGIKDYQQKSRSEFKDWAGDVFSDSISTIMDIWSQGAKKTIKESGWIAAYRSWEQAG